MPRTCGCGSGAASLLAYAYVLGITNVDPVGANLMFERFLNEDRVDPPDLDVDFAWDERDGVLQWMFDTFGRDQWPWSRTTTPSSHGAPSARSPNSTWI